MSQEGHPPNRAASAYSKSRDGAEQSLPTEPPQGALSSGQTAGRQVYLKNTVRVLDPFHDMLFIAMFFENYTKKRVKDVATCEGEAFVTFLEAKGAEKALSVPKLMAGQPISVYAVDPSEQNSQNIHMQKENKASSEKENSSFGEIEVNPNKIQTDRRYQRLESSEYTFEPDKELRGTDKEQRTKSSVSTAGELEARPIDYNVKATHVRNINIRENSDKETCDVTGLVVIPRDIMVVCDNYNNSIKLIDTKQNIITSQIRLPSAPWDTALVTSDVTEEPKTYDLIVTLPWASELRYVRVTCDQIKDTEKDISVKGQCHGIQVSQDRKLAVSYVNPGKVEILDLDGKVLKKLQIDHDGAELFDVPWYIAVSPGSGILYVSDCGNNTLTSIRRDWSLMTKMEGLDTPYGVRVDRAGSVFVCCRDGTIHLLASTGDRSKQFLGKEDGLCRSP